MKRMSGPLFLALALSAGPAVAQDVYVPTTDWGVFRFERDAGLTSGTVAGSADSVFSAMGTILKEFGIKVSQSDKVSREMVVRRQRAFRHLAKRPISTFMSCGQGLTGPNADQWHVFLTLGVKVSPAGPDKSSLAMTLTGDAIDIPGGRSDKIVCASDGRLEIDIVRRLREIFPGTG